MEFKRIPSISIQPRLFPSQAQARADHAVYLTFSIDLILKEIFIHLPVKDLLHCSLVSKKWNWNARGVLRESKKCLAYASRNNWCQDLLSIDSIMGQSVNLPINGLSLSIKDHDCIAFPKLTQAFPFLLGDSFKLIYMELNWVDEMDDCPGVKFLRSIFRKGSTHLRSLEMFKIPNFHSVYDIFEIEPSRRNHWLPNVTTLELPYFIGQCKHLMDEFLAGCPRLENIYGFIGISTLDVVIRRQKSHTIKDFDWCPTDQAEIETCAEFAKTLPKLRRLNINSYLDDKELWSGYLSILRLLLQSSAESLQEMDISHGNVFLIDRLGIPPLTKLHILRLSYCQKMDEVMGKSTLRKLHWGRLFPALDTIEIFDEDFRQEIVVPEFLGVNIWGSCTTPDQECVTVKKFILAVADNYPNPFPVFSVFRELLPNVNNVQMFSCPNVPDYMRALWTTWPFLEYITFYNTSDADLGMNLDGVFCGIDEHSMEYLRNIGSNALQLVRYNPSLPSILDLQHLKSFRLDILHRKNCDPTDKNNVILSDVTGKLVFSRMPGLTVQIARKECHSSWNVPCRFKLDHLSPYAKFFYATGWCPFDC